MLDTPPIQDGASDELMPDGMCHRVSEVTVIQETVAAVFVAPPSTTPAVEREPPLGVGSRAPSKEPGQSMQVGAVLRRPLGGPGLSCWEGARLSAPLRSSPSSLLSTVPRGCLCLRSILVLHGLPRSCVCGHACRRD